MEITDEQYSRLAEHSYWVEEGRNDVDYHPQEQKKYYYNKDDKSLGQYQVLKVKDNTDNGMQAMAVAPVDKNGNVDTSQIVIAYAGTNKSDPKDLDTDLQSVGGGSKKLVSGSDMSVDGLTIADSQFETAMSFAKKIEKEYPKAKITTTGHSLGESLAIYVALKQGYKNVGFNGPDIHNLLSDNEIKYMQKHQEQFRNYRNPHDGIGNITGNETETAIYVDRQNGTTSEDHSLSECRFDQDGNLCYHIIPAS